MNCQLEHGRANLEGADAPPDINAESRPKSDATRENEICPFIGALGMDLVAEKLMSLLNFEDMQSLSTVSTACLHYVRKTKEFSDRARLSVCKKVPSGVLEEMTYPWKNMSIELPPQVEVIGLIQDILPSVASLSLRLPEPELDARDNYTELVNYLTNIIKASTSLINLQLDATIMTFILHDAFSDVELQNILTNLESLEFQSYCTKPRSVCYIDGCEEGAADTPFQRNFLQLSMLPLQLTKLVFGKVLPIFGSESEHVKSIPRIVDSTKDTLVDLELHLNVWKFEEMKEIRCPKLKRLVLSANGNERDSKIISIFIKNQPPLEELTIEMNKEFPFGILQVIQGATTKMKKLHMKTKTFSEILEPVDWSFLESMNKLREFFIRKPYSSGSDGFSKYGYGEEILAKLPNDTEKISLIGFDPFWNAQYLAAGNIGDLLSRFSSLKEINLIRSTCAITDEGLQTIIARCEQLTSLTFSHCPEVTDFGISGIRPNNEPNGVSLKDLKGLTCLKIRSCPNISPDCLLSVIQFSFLRTFDYHRNVQLSKEFVLQIARQNPCLEKLSLHIYRDDDDQDVDYENELKQEVKAINPRLHLIDNHLEQSNWDDEDSDSDASSIHDGDGDSDFSGGGFHMDDYEDNIDDYYDSPDDDFEEEEEIGMFY